ncbi:MAG: peptidase [Bacteroidetes bacterium]|nr:peptidase [Bacteroidota bacterium]MBT4727156.1 peptidase [Bacteroidota bacterium]MBT5529161.1 peptidase [Cytophagia bacterium]MBT5991919.1 peptidase [Bacteroidota bacterium]
MKLTIGRKDKADFPELKLTNISCKIDTGAFTSTIHSHDIKEIIIDGEKYIEFQLLDPSHPKYRDEKLKTKNFTKKNIKNSFGITEERFVIKTIIKIFENEYPIELSLSERSDMKNPILIGRTLLNNRFIVDTDQYNLSYKLKQQKRKNKNK